LKIEIDGTIFDPLAYRSYRPTPELIRGFAGTGLKLANVTHTGMLCTLDVPYSLFGEVWTGPEQFDWKAFDAQMALFEANAPGESRPSLQDNETRAHCRIPLPHCRTWLARGRAVSLWAIQPALACASILCHKWINAMAGQAGGPPSGGGFQRGEVESAGIVTL